MTDSQITCPKCGHKFSLTDAHKHEIEDIVKLREKELEVKFLREQEKKEEEIKREMWMKAQLASQKQFDEKMKALDEESKRKEVELESLRKRDEEACRKEREYYKQTQEFEDLKRNQGLELEKARYEERKKLEWEVGKQAEEKSKIEQEKIKIEYEKRFAEMQKKLEMTQKAVEDANRKANQGSMQIQWEIQEDALKEVLRLHFPIDTLSDVEKGIKGADIIQSVNNKYGNLVWVIAWESKNTKAWSDSWVDKLKEDRLRVNASVSIIVTNTLPDGIKHFWPYRDIWVTEWSYIIPLTIMLREQLVVIDQMKNSLAGKDEKMEVLYNYLTSEQFKAKIENIVEAFTMMKADLEKEKNAMSRIWSSREKQLDSVIRNTSSLYGDMQGLLGNGMRKVQSLELPGGEG